MQRDPQHLKDLMTFKMNGMLVFGCSGADLEIVCLEQAHAIATMIGSAFAENEETGNTNGQIVHRAFDGIATLIALAQFAKFGGETWAHK